MVDHSPHRSSLFFRSYPRLVVAVGFLVLVGSVVIYSINPAWTVVTQIGVSIGAVLLLSAVLLWPHTVHVVLTGRSVRYASNAIVMCLAFMGILVLINFLSLKNNYEFDLTETGEFTLSEETVRVLENLAEPVQIVAFFRAGDRRWAVTRDYLDRYSRYTNLLTYKLHDPDTEPALAESYGLGSYGLVFVSGVHRYEVSKVDEQNITTGLMCVTSHKHNAENQELISLAPKQPTNRHIFLTPLQMGLTFFIALILIPLVAFIAGVRVWWSSR